MTFSSKLGLLFLHALPFDGSMWDGQRDLLPAATYTPTLYGFGDRLESWAVAALSLVQEERIVVVGCSIGGSCALEIAAIAPKRIAALVLIGTKAVHRPDPASHASVLEVIRKRGLEDAWQTFWAPLFSGTAHATVLNAARKMLVRQSAKDIARGVTAFHTRRSRDDVLATLRKPIALVSGAEDTAPGPETSAAQAGSARYGELHVVTDCGHYVPLEKPEQLNVMLRDIFRKSAEI